MLDALAIAAVIYTVKPGDTLWAISPGHNWAPVCQENRLPNCDLIYPGQRLRIGGAKVTVSLRANSTPRRLSEPHRASFNGSLAGTLGCSGLESLWDSAGGNRGSAFIAAEIAMAESGGRQYATGPAGERGYWQIHPDHGSLSTYNAYGNARAAVIISGNGSNWSPWTTFTSGAYIGRCLCAIGLPHPSCNDCRCRPSTDTSSDI